MHDAPVSVTIGDANSANCTGSDGLITCSDEGAAGDPEINHFYMVRAFNTAGAWIDTSRTGEFDFALLPGNP